MKTHIPILIAAALLTSGCEKQEETKPAPVVRTPAPEEKSHPAPVVPAPQAPAAPDRQSPTTPPTAEEIHSFLADLDKLAKEVAQLPKDATPSPEVDEMQKTYAALIQRRNALMASMNEEQKAKLMQDVNPLAKVAGPPLVRLRMAKARERMKGIASPHPGSKPADPGLDDLIPQLKTSPAKPPAPAKQTAPPQPAPPK